MAAPTPHSRILALLEKALPLLSPDHPACKLIHEAQQVASGFEPYMSSVSSSLMVPSSHSVPEEAVRKTWEDLLKATAEEDWDTRYKNGETQWRLNAGMCSGEYEAIALQSLALSSKTKRVLEIGTFTGTVTVGLDEKDVRCFWTRAGVSSKITTSIGPALDSLHSLASARSEPFDLIFIDADKPSYEKYIRLVLDLELLAEGGVILADNTLYKGLPWTKWDRPQSEVERTKGSNNQDINEATQGILDFNTFVKNDPRLVVCVLPLRDGVSVIQRRV